MKSILNRSRIVLATILVAAVHSVSNAQSVPPSPVLATNAGWDCVLSGKGGLQGILFLTFSGDGYFGDDTFTGVMTLAKVSVPKVSVDRSGSSSDRDPASPPPSGITNIFGFIRIEDGKWNYDAKGYTVGVFSYGVVVGGSTNLNQVSFKAKVAPNKRFTASYSSSVSGNGTIRGVPMKTVTDLTGGWSGAEKRGSFTSYEWLSLENAGETWPNLYTADGYGPGYNLTESYCMVSSQKKIGFGSRVSATETNENDTVRGTVGSFINKTTSLGGKTKGLSTSGTNVIRYDAFRVVEPD